MAENPDPSLREWSVAALANPAVPPMAGSPLGYDKLLGMRSHAGSISSPGIIVFGDSV